MEFVAAACGIWWMVLMGVGSWLFRGIGGERGGYSPVMRGGLCVVMGMMGMAVVGEVVNFWWPVYPVWPCVMVIIGGVGWWVNWRWLVRGVRGIDVWVAIALIAAASVFAMRTPVHVDTGLYHLQAVRWITDSRLVWGLANLHLRLGYNSAWEMVAGMMEGPGMLGRSMFVLNTLLVAVAGCVIWDAARRVVLEGMNVADGLLVLLGYPVVDMAIGRGTTPTWATSVPSLGNDLAGMVLVVLGLALLVRRGKSEEEDVASALMGVVLGVFGVVVKVSTGPLLVGGVGVWVWRMWKARDWRSARVGIVVGVVVLGAWMGRGVGLSGCPVYPATVGRLPVKWAVEVKSAARDRMWITKAARDVADRPVKEVMRGWGWVGPWARWIFKDERGARVGVGMVIVGLIGIGYGVMRGKKIAGRVWVVWGIAGAGVGYWFVLAPDPRFGYGFIDAFCVMTLMMGLCMAGVVREWGRWVLVVVGIGGAVVGGSSPLKRLPGWGGLFGWPEVPVVKVVGQKTADGLTVWVPPGRWAWRGPLPSTWNIAPGLRAERDEQGRVRMFWIQREAAGSE